MIIINTTIDIASPPKSVFLGRCQEHEFRRLIINVSAWLTDYPNGLITVVYQRPDGELYPVVVNAEGPEVEWIISDTDTAVAGLSKFEVRLTQGDILGKSAVITAYIQPALGTPEVPPEAPVPDWVSTVAGYAQIAAGSAEAAEQAMKLALEVIPIGGSEGQVLTKVSDKDRDTAWMDPQGKGDGNVYSTDVEYIAVLDQEEYDALTEKSPTTLYLIRG